ncbi:MAG: PP2C family serine/threonine-protein phosphatase [Clostridium sp.]|nr:PP2C family serine/threonine-protein phosphatase [Clostridium sp.]
MFKYSFEVSVVTDKGNIKKVNQDNILVNIGEYNHEDFGVFVVCDGVGGLSSGEMASAIAVKNLQEWWNQEIDNLIQNFIEEEIKNSLTNIINKINKEIIEYSKANNSKMGTTLSLLLLIKKKYYIAHVGDSRIYKINKDIKQLTEDQSYVAMKVKNGEMTKEEAEKSSKKNLLLQCIGVKENLNIFFSSGKLKKSDVFIVCSDGFYKTYPQKEILHQIFSWKKNNYKEPQKFAKDMVEKAKEYGEKDNISIIIVKSKNRLGDFIWKR